MKRFSKYFLVVAAGALLGSACNASPDVSAPRQNSSVVIPTQQSPQAKSFSYKGVAGQDALSLLKKSHRVETKDYGKDLGEFVVSIEGIKPASNEFWAFYVNGKSSTVGASSYKAKEGDIIEWKLEKIK